jgi:hypothetical protein
MIRFRISAKGKRWFKPTVILEILVLPAAFREVFPVITINVAGSRWSQRRTNISELSVGINFQEQTFVVALDPEARGVS